MAKQHFYSRVPSRMSMFLKADGFDTFACSQGVNREYFEKDMLALLEQKPTNEEVSLIRNNQLLPVYMSYSLKDGTYVQSCVSYIPLDYTGERSNYLVHSLLFDEEEQEDVLNHFDYQLINEDLFIHTLDSFDITSASSKSNNQYPELAYIGKELFNNYSDLIEKLDTITLKKCLFALYCAITNKAKNIFILLPKEFDDDMKLAFFNTIIQVFPYHLRKHLSFVSRVIDINKYSNFKVRVLADDVGNIPPTKGITVNFRTKDVIGIKDIDLKNFGHLADFSYSLFKDNNLRSQFLINTQSEVALYPALGNLNFKEIEDLINLFKAGSEFYNEYDVIPNDDKMLDCIQNYEKYRNALSTEYRIHTITALKRYAQNYQPIPKNIFNKIAKIYPSEIHATKHLIMNICLDLIHTDLMRPMLFNFIKNNFNDEDADTKSVIVQHLASVFYGGFLQTQIIALFDELFDEESEENRFVIIEKLMLAIRTKEIQQPLFEFVSKHYQIFNKKEKLMLYEAIGEHLSEGDNLAEKLLNLCDNVVENEEEDIQKLYSKKLFGAIDEEFKRHEDALLKLLAKTYGYSFKLIINNIFNSWKTKKLTSDFINLCCNGSLQDRINKIIDIWNNAPEDIDQKLASNITKACIQGFNDHPQAFTLAEVLDAKKNINTNLNYPYFVNEFNEQIIDSLIDKSLLLIFDSKDANKVEEIMEEIKDSPSLQETDNYVVLKTYCDLKNNIIQDDFANAAMNAEKISSLTKINRRISNYLKLDLIDSGILRKDQGDDLDYVTPEILALIMANFIANGQYGFDKAFDLLWNRFSEIYDGIKEKDFCMQYESCLVTKDILNYASQLFKTTILPESIKSKVMTEESGIVEVAKDIIVKYSVKQLKAIFNKVSQYSIELFQYLLDQTVNVKTNAKLFAKIIK